MEKKAAVDSAKVKQLLGEEAFSSFLKDVYASYRLKITDTKGVLEILKKKTVKK